MKETRISDSELFINTVYLQHSLELTREEFTNNLALRGKGRGRERAIDLD